MNDRATQILAWTGVTAGWVLQHVNTIAVLLATGLAAAASFYSWRINRRKDRQMRAAEEHACEACNRTQNPFNCPYPSPQRPDGCWLRKELERPEP